MKFLKYLFLILGCLIWAISISQPLFSLVGSWHLIHDGYQYGDLFRLSTLSEFRDPRVQCEDYTPPAHARPDKKVHLYVIGDSFTEKQRVSKKDFVVDNYTQVKWDDFLHIKIDTSETNILLLESVERHLRQKMVARIKVLIPDTATFVTTTESPKILQQLDNALKANFTADRLDGLLFQNDIFLTLKSWKADFNYKVFDRVNKSVTLVNDDRDMVYYLDTDTPNVTSSFSEIRNTEIDTVVMNLNRSRDFADSLGFDHVILSIIPNKVSVLSPNYGTYNRLIERVYAHPNLKLPYVDILADYRKMGRHSYLKGDSHWTCDGQYLWLNKVNALINRLVEPATPL
ncbi:hypothetical protein [Dyadobacter pollutisoli]|uniref:AlgX/AlgJ SGNH hydrolase-like domain-containing protein n=1 Tax=Dyadobacter pollutisoli TaxID=2910158 RepID=A0A9E8N6V6_9BACT|nr:hypothetical protein [Dyadobacter pollutisoli]WAC09666.1 hypothetical protein ON006_18105 [Dyadobacter pollutisoli]